MMGTPPTPKLSPAGGERAAVRPALNESYLFLAFVAVVMMKLDLSSVKLKVRPSLLSYTPKPTPIPHLRKNASHSTIVSHQRLPHHEPSQLPSSTAVSNRRLRRGCVSVMALSSRKSEPRQDSKVTA